MGAGGKADPTRIRISALADCINDPLASKIKWKLKKHDVDPEKVMSIFSVEKPMCDLLPLDEEQKNNPQVTFSGLLFHPLNDMRLLFPTFLLSIIWNQSYWFLDQPTTLLKDYGVVDYIRLRVMPVLGTSPSIFGQAMASYVLCSLAGDWVSATEFYVRFMKSREFFFSRYDSQLVLQWSIVFVLHFFLPLLFWLNKTGKMYDPEVCERMSKNLKHKMRQTFQSTEVPDFVMRLSKNISLSTAYQFGWQLNLALYVSPLSIQSTCSCSSIYAKNLLSTFLYNFFGQRTKLTFHSIISDL